MLSLVGDDSLCSVHGVARRVAQPDTALVGVQYRQNVELALLRSLGNLWPQSLPKFVPIGFKYIEDNPNYDEKKVVETTYEPNLTKEVIVSSWINQEDVEMYSEYASAIRDYFNQNQARFISGEQDVNDDAVWEEYKAGFEAMGTNLGRD